VDPPSVGSLCPQKDLAQGAGAKPGGASEVLGEFPGGYPLVMSK